MVLRSSRGETGIVNPGAGDVSSSLLDAFIVALGLLMFQYKQEWREVYDYMTRGIALARHHLPLPRRSFLHLACRVFKSVYELLCDSTHCLHVCSSSCSIYIQFGRRCSLSLVLIWV
ncbi:hypothetical protein EJ05DRAFT_21181 [Pseudovirgaria hyperparasitica]|uniref:Uncharacterized protein n=1 Tax=Pseudovirgaria hyperparasitica TaxID=470096 RepID=A0A6A6WL53_9PEZI|nr:uncharacterized protein EJ05DRAFT_21181 [Pseudovirgaria hyperparasitica]KAF2762940.1 hypothetical protein EJ05DRAFT_21181 [Pseudovirgaria hyperparasitica]